MGVGLGTVEFIRKTVHNEKDPVAGMWKVLKHFKNETKSEVWNTLPEVDLQKDVSSTAEWLKEQCSTMPGGNNGIYLGLDTLNMDGGDGKNLEIGSAPGANISDVNLKWTGKINWYGPDFLLRGLYDYYCVYGEDSPSPWKSDLFNYADYGLFLSYSGLVLARAFETLSPADVLGGEQPARVAAWGFHDGDLFRLGVMTSNGFERVHP